MSRIKWINNEQGISMRLRSAVIPEKELKRLEKRAQRHVNRMYPDSVKFKNERDREKRMFYASEYDRMCNP